MGIATERAWIPSAIGAVAAATFLIFHLDQPWLTHSEPTPILVPCLISIVLLVACIVDVVTVMGASVPADADADDGAGNGWRLAWYLGSLGAFALLMRPLGFLPVVVVVLPLLLVFGERLPVLKSVVVTVVTAAVVYIVFDLLLAVDLPHGTLFSRWF